MLQLRNLDPRVVFVLAGHAQILNHIVGLLCEISVDIHSSLGVGLGHFEKVTCKPSQRIRDAVSYLLLDLTQNVDQCMVEHLEQGQQIQDQQPENSNGNLVFRLIVQYLDARQLQS